jgi:hypothetical protein
MHVQKGIKDRLIFILYNLIFIIVSLGISESMAFYLLNNPEKIPGSFLNAFRAYYTQHLRSTIQMEPECAIYDRELFYTLKPGKSTFKNLEFENTILVNSQGTRDDEESLSNPEIILLGDSFTMGWGVNQDSTFEKLLEKSLRKKVLNAGISSYGTVRELMLLNRIQKDSLKVIVIQYHDSDLIENKEFRDTGDTLIISSQENYESTSHNVRSRVKYFPGKHTSLLFKFWLKDKLGRMEVRKPTGKDDAQYFINALKKSSIPGNVRIIVFEVASYGLQNNSFIAFLNDELLAHPDLQLNITTVNIQSNLTSTNYFRVDDHINASGHETIAELLTKSIIGMSMK